MSKDPAWLTEVQTIKPLAAGKTTPKKSVTLPQPENTIILPHLQAKHPLEIICHSLQHTAALAPNYPKHLLKELQKGQQTPTATLDLHGHLQAEAIQTLNLWLHEAQINDHRCVLVITGKGRGYGDTKNMGLLKYNLPYWLAYHPMVVAIHTATPYYGGSGAYFILLKKL